MRLPLALPASATGLTGAVILSLLLAAAASANERSQALSARALVALHAGDTPAAQALLDEAVAADPDDADVRYQRGVVRARAGDRDGAADDLARALALRPWFPNAALEYGIVLIDDERPADAELPLMQAQQVPALDAQASFYLALAQLRLGRFDAAEASLARARRADPSLTAATRYYEGVIAFRRADYVAAEEAFAAVQRERPDTAMAREAAQYIQLIAETRAADYALFGTAALEYDSNVTLGPSQTIPGSASGRGDGRFVFNAGGRWTALRRGGFSLALSYEFFQSAQFHLTSFNLQDNRPGIRLQYDLGMVSFGVAGRYDYYLLDTDSFLSEFTALPWVSIREEGIGNTDLYVRIQPRDYKQRAYEVLNGVYSFAGVRQFLDLGSAARQLWVGYQLGFSSPDDTTDIVDEFNREQYQYGSHAAEIGVRTPLPFAVLGELVYRYEYQHYAAASGCVPPVPASAQLACAVAATGGPLPGGLSRRDDHDHRVIFTLERQLPELWEPLWVAGTYFGTINDSNKPQFEYERHIGSLALQVRY